MGAPKIITEHVYPPIPFRGCDWAAYYDGYEPGAPYGQGATEAEAIAALLENTGDEAADGAPTNALPYGIIDPDYARVFTVARCIAWAEGYAIMMHGSFTRDLDLIAVPWTDEACEPEHLARRVEDAAGLKLATAEPGQKPHGRLAWTLLFPGFSDPRFVDLSVLPRVPAPSLSAGGND